MNPLEHGWWLASRSAGVVALLCVSVSVGIGLAMAARMAPGRARTLMAAHQQTALIGLLAIAVHGIALLGDAFLRPGLLGIAVPGLIDYERPWTALGVAGGWLAAILGLSYWLRDRIGATRWRRLHKATLLVYLLSVAHTLGAGTDAGQAWLQVLLAATGAPVLFLFVVRILPAPRRDDGFRRMRVTAVTPESADVISLALAPVDGEPLAPHAPGQFVTVRIGGEQRSYSLSAAHGHRISVKRDGVVSTRLHALEEGDVLEVSAPAGAFTLDRSERPAVLLSAGIGATPVLAMLTALAQERSEREVWWIHSARDAAHHPFREEARALVDRLPHGHHHVTYTRDSGRLDAQAIRVLGVPADAVWHVCGTPGFVATTTAGVEHVRSESFGGGPAGPDVVFSRSGKRVRWEERFPSLLDLAEAHDVPVAAGCRVGACHGCRAGVLEGATEHATGAAPPEGCALLCCARPATDLVVLDA